MSYQLLSIKKIDTDPAVPFPCYFVMSTAPINIEDSNTAFGEAASKEESSAALAEMTAYLKRNHTDAEVLVMVHGYNTGCTNVHKWYRDAAIDITRRYAKLPKGLVLIGYRWSSEQMNGDESGDVKSKRQSARQSLPGILDYIYRFSLMGTIAGLVGSFIGYGVLLAKGVSWLAILIIFSGLFTVAMLTFAPLMTILALRLSNYFRDTFRANQYGAADLVELIRQLDDGLVEKVMNPDRTARENYWGNHRIRLSFVGHSMGAFVVTNAVRVLSNVFARDSIGGLGLGAEAGKRPSSELGNVFSLGRLVLVAPDISSETIISGRANFLQSSLRRFEEAYLFCNEGDMALRLASATANYFSFPAKTRDGGYRLGNVTVREASAIQKIEMAGIVNLLENGELVKENVRAFLSYLYIRRSRSLLDRQVEIGLDEGTQSIAELFTYFDCTNYYELIPNPQTKVLERKGILTRANNKTSLEMIDYALLCKDFIQGKRDPHGGYIFSEYADFTKRAIYGLACLGWDGFLETLQAEPDYNQYLQQAQQDGSIDLNPDQQQELARLFALNALCKNKGVQVLMSPERYHVNVLDEELDRSAY